MGEVIEENGLGPHIRYRHKVLTAAWSQAEARWTVTAERTDTGGPVRFSARFLFMCQGYYRHRSGYMPEWPGTAEFRGPIVHTEDRPEDLAWAGTRVVVSGSGATAPPVLPPRCGTPDPLPTLRALPTPPPPP